MNIALVFLAILLSTSAYSAVLLEPRLLQSEGELEVSNFKTNFTKDGTGLDIGYMGNYFLVGISLEKTRLRFDSPFLTETNKYYDGGGIGTFLGFHFLDRFRIQTSYLNSTLDPHTDLRYFGQYFSYGIGLRLHQGLMLNLAQFSNFYTQIENDITGKTNGLESNIETNGTIISLSYILTVN